MQNEERINGLENQVRTLKRIVYGFGCLLVIGIVIGATSLQNVPEVIQAKNFEVVNDEGQKLVRLTSSRLGGYVQTLSKEGQELVRITCTTGSGGGIAGGYIATKNKEGRTRVTLGINNNGDGCVETWNREGIELVRLSGNDYGGYVATLNKENEALVKIGTAINGEEIDPIIINEARRASQKSKEERLEDSTSGDVNILTLTAKEVAKEFDNNKSRAISTFSQKGAFTLTGTFMGFTKASRNPYGGQGFPEALLFADDEYGTNGVLINIFASASWQSAQYRSFDKGKPASLKVKYQFFDGYKPVFVIVK